MGRIEWQRGAPVASRSTRCDCRTSRELIDFAAELPGAVTGDRRLVIETIPARDIDRAFEHQPRGYILLADCVDAFSRREMFFRPTRKSPRGFDLRSVQNGERLMLAGAENAHRLSTI